MKCFIVAVLVASLLAVQVSSVQSTCTYNGIQYSEGAKMDTYVLGLDMCQSVYCTNGNQEWRTDACKKRSVNPFDPKARSVPQNRARIIEKILETFKNL